MAKPKSKYIYREMTWLFPTRLTICRSQCNLRINCSCVLHLSHGFNWLDKKLTRISWKLKSLRRVNSCKFSAEPLFQEFALIFSWRVGLNLSVGWGGGVGLNSFQELALIFSWKVWLNLSGGGGLAWIQSKSWP